MTTFAGEQAVSVFQMTAVASGLRLYAKTGMKPNAHYTPKNMMAFASRVTGQKFKARAYEEAAEALRAKAASLAGEIHAGQHPGNEIKA